MASTATTISPPAHDNVDAPHRMMLPSDAVERCCSSLQVISTLKLCLEDIFSKFEKESTSLPAPIQTLIQSTSISVKEVLQEEQTQLQKALDQYSEQWDRRHHVGRHLDYIHSRLADRGNTSSTTTTTTTTDATAQVNPLFRKSKALLRLEYLARESRIKKPRQIPKRPPFQHRPPYPPPYNGVQFGKKEAMTILQSVSPKVRRHWIDDWIQNALVPVGTRDTVIRTFRQFQKGQSIHDSWGKGRPPLLSIIEVQEVIQELKQNSGFVPVTTKRQIKFALREKLQQKLEERGEDINDKSNGDKLRFSVERYLALALAADPTLVLEDDIDNTIWDEPPPVPAANRRR